MKTPAILANIMKVMQTLLPEEEKQALKECVSILYRSLKLLVKQLINAPSM